MSSRNAFDDSLDSDALDSHRRRSHIRELTGANLADLPCVLRVSLSSGLQLREATLRFISAYVTRQYSGRTAERIAVAIYELLSNGLDYACIASNVVVELRVGHDQIAVLVSNVAIEARVNMLQQQLNRLATDPTGTFEQEMSASLIAEGGRAKLGLARICHEASLDLGVSIDAERVTITACCRR